jgi:single-stranded DNA-binding protein
MEYEGFTVTRTLLRVERTPRPEVPNPGEDVIHVHFYNDFGKLWEPHLKTGSRISIEGHLRIREKYGKLFVHVKATKVLDYQDAEMAAA